MLQDSLQRFLAQGLRLRAAPRARWPRPRASRARPGRSSPSWACWASRFPRTHGGLGGDAVRHDGGDGGARAARCGRALSLRPWCWRGGTIADAGTRRAASDWLPAIAGGEMLARVRARRAARALRRGPRRDHARRSDGDGWKLDGHKAVVLRRAARPTRCSCPRALRAAPATSGGISLFLVDAKAKGVDDARATPRRTASAPPRCSSTGVHVGADALVGARGRGAARRSSARSTAASRRSAPRRVGIIDALNASDARIPEDAQAVRPAHRPLPGAAAPHGRHDHRARCEARSMAIVAAVGCRPRRDRARAPRMVRAAKALRRPGGALRRPAGGAAARRHRRHRRADGEPLVQAPHR